MDRFVIKYEYGFSCNCFLCSRKGNCFSEEDCIGELKERLYHFEEETEQLNNKLRSNPIISKLMDKMKG